MSAALPASLTGSPVSALVPVGQCQFGTEFTSVKLVERFPVSKTSSVLRFECPDTKESLGLSTCACILANAEIDGENVIRPYTPISTNAAKGYFDLLIKNYGAPGKMSRYMHEIKSGDEIKFKHIPFNVKQQAPFEYDNIGMLVGGTGVAPMIQALHAILGSSGSKKPVVTMLYGSRVSDDILGQELLHKWAAEYPDQFKLVDILSHEPADSDWKGERGFIDKACMEKYFPKPEDDKFQIWICGPPPMYDVLSGPRTETDVVKGVLGEMGYSPEQVYKF